MLDSLAPVPTAGLPEDGDRPGRPAARFRFWGWWLPLATTFHLALFSQLLDDPWSAARQGWPLFFVGVAGAVLGNATAVGGGIVFVPVMMLVYRLPPVASLQLALVVQAFGMTSGAVAWLRRGAVPLRALPVAIPPLLLGSALSTLVFHPDALLVKGLFGPTSIFVGLVTFRLVGRRGNRREVPRRAYLPLAAVACVGGLLTGWVAIGEGEVVAAFLMLGFGLAAERGIGLGTVLLSVNSIFLALLHGLVVGGVPWGMAGLVSLGCLYGGWLGPILAGRLPRGWLKRGFATLAVADGTVILLQFLAGP